MRGNWFVTPHAVQRYIERFEPGLNHEEALEHLIAMSENVRYIKTFDHGDRAGLELWRGPRPRKFRFWVGRKEDGAPQLVTIMGGHDPEWRH
jgi:hypothetical protein